MRNISKEGATLLSTIHSSDTFKILRQIESLIEEREKEDILEFQSMSIEEFKQLQSLLSKYYNLMHNL